MLQSVILKEEQRRKGEKRKQEQHGETKPDENLFSPKVIFFKFGATLQKHYIKLQTLLNRLGLPVSFLLPFLSFSSLFFLQDD